MSYPRRTVGPVRTLEDRDRERTAFLLTLYELTDGEPGTRTGISVVGERLGLDLGLDRDEAMAVYQWLKARGLAEHKTMGGNSLEITPLGVDKSEEILRDGYQQPASVLILTTDEQRAVEAFLTEYRRAARRDLAPR